MLRANGTAAEAQLWARLRNRALGGLKFVRQAPVGPYFVDFLCREKRLIVEVDGATHGEEVELAADRAREAELARLGYHVFRVTNADVAENIDGVLDTIMTVSGEAGE